MANPILIVDDQSGIRLLLEEVLKSGGYQTLSAKSGQEACELAQNHAIDLMIMDYNLPVMHGREVLDRMAEMGGQFPVLIITGDSPESVKKEVDHSFVKDIISKPFDIQYLQEMVSNVLEKTKS